MKKRYGKELVGKKFGRLTITTLFDSPGNGTQALFTCECGAVGQRDAWRIVCGYTKSCGCYRSETTVARCTTHGQSKSRLYKLYVSMLTRCYNEKALGYKDYGAKGITVCVRWRKSFETFAEDMGPRPSTTHTLDRVDYRKGYSPRNCRWATPEEQANNTSANILYTYKGQRRTLKQWSREVGINYACLYWRHQQGWPIAQILETPSARPANKKEVIK